MVQKFKTMDGNEAAAYVSYAFTEVATIYPITPSSPMPEHVDTWAANGMKNIFGKPVQVVEMQSEAGAAGAVHGSLAAGALTSTYTASQGLLLMIPDMYKIAGENLPGVFHVAARAVASHALSIYGDHSDINSARMTGFAFLCSSSVQEVMDLGAVAHLSAIEGSLPFCHFFDGFRTSHEINKVAVWDFKDLDEMVDHKAIQAFRDRSMNPNRPKTMGTSQSPDIFFQNLEASNRFYEDIIPIVEKNMAKVSEKTGRSYHLFDYYGDPEAENVVVLMGSACEAMEEVIDAEAEKGNKLGMIKVRLYRPFSRKHFLEALPKNVKKIAVLDRTKEKGALGEPLYMDVCAALYDADIHPVVVGGRYGMGSKDTIPTHLLAVFRNLEKDEPKNHFTISIEDDVTNLSLDQSEVLRIREEGTTRCKFWGFGSDGTVGANKQAIKIIGDNTDQNAQGYFFYDSKKSGGLTISHLRFGKNKIRSTYLLDEADFVSCSKQAYVHQYDLLRGLKQGGVFLLNCTWAKEELEDHLPGQMKRYLAENNIQFYIINASKLAQDIGLGNRTNMIIQSAFFKLSGVLPIEEAVAHLKDSIVKAYGHKGDDVVNMNNKAVDAGIEALERVDIPSAWATAEDETVDLSGTPEFFKKVVRPMLRNEGDDLPVSAFVGREDGHWDAGTSEYEKRGIALYVPEWQIDNCIQCNQCSYVCPHAVIRPFLLNEEEQKNAPEGFVSKKAIGKDMEGLNFRIQVSQLDCTGCGNCADVCPAKTKALVMKPFEEQYEAQKGLWEYAHEKVGYKEVMPDSTIKGSQFKQPLLEFSGACAGCGETPYARLLTQLFGDRMLIANATGCSSIWGASAPSTPYTVDANGCGPAWGNSLFEDAAEYGYGMLLATESNRDLAETKMKQFLELQIDTPLNELFTAWMEGKSDYRASKAATADILEAAKKGVNNAEGQKLLDEIIDLKDYMIKKSQWIFGGDGWAFDIGYGGLDHVLASGKDVNILVMNTEVYSNTGGQSSKATPLAAIAQFAASGKRIKSKDLGLMQSTYGYVYVAQIAMGANQNQTIKALREAEAYNGPSLIIAYAPCINHGIRIGMGKSQEREKQAVEAGYWHLWRYNPLLAEEGKNPFQLDSKEPTADFQEFLMGEVRYSSLKRNFPKAASELYAAAEKAAKERYENYKRLAAIEY